MENIIMNSICHALNIQFLRYTQFTNYSINFFEVERKILIESFMLTKEKTIQIVRLLFIRISSIFSNKLFQKGLSCAKHHSIF